MRPILSGDGVCGTPDRRLTASVGRAVLAALIATAGLLPSTAFAMTYTWTQTPVLPGRERTSGQRAQTGPVRPWRLRAAERERHIDSVAVDLVANAKHLVDAVIPLVSGEPERADDAMMTVLHGLQPFGDLKAFSDAQGPRGEDQKFDAAV